MCVPNKEMVRKLEAHKAESVLAVSSYSCWHSWVSVEEVLSMHKDAVYPLTSVTMSFWMNGWWLHNDGFVRRWLQTTYSWLEQRHLDEVHHLKFWLVSVKIHFISSISLLSNYRLTSRTNSSYYKWMLHICVPSSASEQLWKCGCAKIK